MMENPTVDIMNNLINLYPDNVNIIELFTLTITQYLQSILNDPIDPAYVIEVNYCRKP